jgi:LysR family hydrogen peroxide-inducible transcriptional activator
MTLTQLEYIVALDTHRHFAHAAEQCYVTQPTLSMQIQKLEDELGVKLFDRTKQPVIPTEAGEPIIAQARIVLQEAEAIKEQAANQKNNLGGELRLGIIPTLAPYLLPPLYKQLQQKHPAIKFTIKELVTEQIVWELKNNLLDCAIVVTPLQDATMKEDILFYEELFVYISPRHQLNQKKYVLASDIDPQQLLLLEEGHCFRSQILNLCELRQKSNLQFKYETGNIETLKRMVEKSDGLTILPEMAVRELTKAQQQLVKPLQKPRPVREISLITHRHHIKTRLIKTVKEEILQTIPKPMRQLANKKVVEIGGV